MGTSAMFELLSPARIVLTSVNVEAARRRQTKELVFMLSQLRETKRAFHPSCLVYPPVPLPLLAGLCYITC